MSECPLRNNCSNRSLTVAAQNAIPSRDRQGAVIPNWNRYSLTETESTVITGELGLAGGSPPTLEEAFIAEIRKQEAAARV